MVGAFHHTEQIEVTGGHRPTILLLHTVRLLPLRRTAHSNTYTQNQRLSSLRAHAHQLCQKGNECTRSNSMP